MSLFTKPQSAIPKGQILRPGSSAPKKLQAPEGPKVVASAPEPKKEKGECVIEMLDQLCHDYASPERIEREIFVTCPPTFLSTEVPNNVFMGRGKKTEPIDHNRVMETYRKFSGMMRGLGVKVIEMHERKECQDQAYVANIGLFVPPDKIIISNFSAAGRQCEEEPALAFFHELGFSPVRCPYDWEGEADLKYLRRGLYAGGIGQFSKPEAYEWISKHADIEIIQVEEISKELYHLDCSLLPIDPNNILITPEGLSKKSIEALQKRIPHVWITPKEFYDSGFTNVVLIRHTYPKFLIHEEYETPQEEAWMDHFCYKFGFVDLSLKITDYAASGADFSCCHFHLTGWDCPWEEERHGSFT